MDLSRGRHKPILDEGRALEKFKMVSEKNTVIIPPDFMLSFINRPKGLCFIGPYFLRYDKYYRFEFEEDFR